MQNQDFFEKVDFACRAFHDYMSQKDTWAKKERERRCTTHPWRTSALNSACMKVFAFTRAASAFSPGDHAKSASDLGLPFVGVTLFYRQGYFQQQISNEGWQQERYPVSEPGKLPIRQVVDRKGNPLICDIEIGNDIVRFQSWSVDVGRVKIYLLDTDLPQNDQRYRDLTAHVYGGDQSTRIAQEIILGIGGVRLLRALGINPSVFHMNEGHSAFLTLELMREQLHAKKSLPVAEAFVKQRTRLHHAYPGSRRA